MVQGVSIPLGINICIAIALASVMAFTLSRVLATAPAAAFVGQPKAAHTVTKEEYFGIVAWVGKDSIDITDSYGVSRVFTIDQDTHILASGGNSSEQSYKDIRMLSHVRISTIKDYDQERASVITVL